MGSSPRTSLLRRLAGPALLVAGLLAGGEPREARGQLPLAARAVADVVVLKKQMVNGECVEVNDPRTKTVGGLGADNVATGQVTVSNSDCDGEQATATAFARAVRSAALLGVLADGQGQQTPKYGNGINSPGAFALAEIVDEFTLQPIGPGIKRALVTVTFIDLSDASTAASPCGPLGGPCREVELVVDSAIVYDEGGNLSTGGTFRVAPGFRRPLKRFVAIDLNTPEPASESLIVTMTAHNVGPAGTTSIIGAINLELPDDVIQQIAGDGRQPRLGLGEANPDFVVRPGQAIRAAEGSLTITPGSGVLVPGQAFDLGLVAQTAGHGIVAAAATLDGVDVSPVLNACLAAHPGALALATPGVVFRCPGLNGSLLGPGTHTLAVTLTLDDGRALTDSAVWEVPGAAAPAAVPRLRVSPPPGLLTQNQAFDLVLLMEAPGREVLFGQVIIDGQDVTLGAVACFVPSALPTGEVVLTCPGLSGAALGLGTHILEVPLVFSDGTVLQGGAVWTVLAATGP